MLKLLALCGPAAFAQQRLPTDAVSDAYPDLPIAGLTAPKNDPPNGWLVIGQRAWQDDGFDPTTVDRQVAEINNRGDDLVLQIIGDGAPEALGQVALEVVTRYQRLLLGGNRATASETFARALGLHAALFDRRKPLVAADFDHALDVWRWVLRLAPNASLAVQLAALFHDIERLISESDVRIEHTRLDYVAFKTAHAAAGAHLTAALLSEVGADDGLIGRITTLVRDHERPSDDAEKQLLNRADALSFFSLNSCGFIAYYGIPHTQRKIAYTLARLGPNPGGQLRGIRLRADIAALVDQALAHPRTPGPTSEETSRAASP
jgi:hypothetical protein